MARDPVNLIDRHVGRRIRVRREMLRMSPAEAAARLGVSQDVYAEYELGHLRVEAVTLMRLVPILGVKVRFFFDGLAGEQAQAPLVQGALARKGD